MGRLIVQQAEWNFFLFTLVIFLFPPFLQANCPAQCSCVPANKSAGGQEVSCNGKDLKQLPKFPSDMVSLDFSGNKLTRIPAGVFATLHNLKSLWLDNNKISHIEAFAFRGVHDYEILSIRGNRQLNQLTKYSLSGIRGVRNFILTDNNISWIEKNAFYGTRQIALLALYGNPLTELRPSTLNNLRQVEDLRLPLGIRSILPGAFYGLSDVRDLVLEGLRMDNLKSGAFFNLTNVAHLKVHDSSIDHISPRAFAGMHNISLLTFSYSTLPNIDADIFQGAEKFTRLVFEKNNLAKIQLDFPEAIRNVADKVTYDANEANCSAISLHNLKVWRNSAALSHWVNDFLHGLWCFTPKWVLDESLHALDLATLRLARSGALDKRLHDQLQDRLNEKPPLAELYARGSKNSGSPHSFHFFLLFLSLAFSIQFLLTMNLCSFF